MKHLLTAFFVFCASMASAIENAPGVASQYNTRLQEMLSTTGWNLSRAMDTRVIYNEWQLNQARAKIKFNNPGMYYGRVSKVITDSLGVNLIIDQGKSTAVTVILEPYQAWPWDASGNQLKIDGLQSSMEFAANIDAGQLMYFQCRRVQFGAGIYLNNCLAFPPYIAVSTKSLEISTSMDPGISLDDLIRARAAEGWARPPSVKKGTQVTLQIGMLPDGTITSVDVVTASGDELFDNSVVAAIKNIGVVTEAQDVKPAKNGRDVLNISFTPENLSL